MAENPKISVVMAVYNGQDYLQETMDSILAQTFTDFEFVIIDDGSSDQTPEILARYAARDKRVQVHRNPENLRLPGSLNRGWSLAKGKYIVRMDADDIALPNRLEKQFAFMEKHKNVAVSACLSFPLRNGVCSIGVCGRRCSPDAINALLLFYNPILHPGVIAKAEVMRKYEYNPKCTCTEDLDIWSRMAANGETVCCQNEYLLLYRLHDKQITATTLEKQRVEVEKIGAQYYKNTVASLNEPLLSYYLDAAYFRSDYNVQAIQALFRFIKQNGKKNYTARGLAYALAEIVSEYRNHVSASDLKSLLCFGGTRLWYELLAKKIRNKKDIQKAKKQASALGMKALPFQKGEPRSYIYSIK